MRRVSYFVFAILLGLSTGAVVSHVVIVDAQTPVAQYERLTRRTMPAPHWSVTHSPSSATQATASRAAGAAGLFHVADCVTATFAATSSAPGAASQVTVNLRDGATGAGTVVASWDMTLPATANTASPPWQQCGLHIAGSSATAMTLEFSGAGA